VLGVASNRNDRNLGHFLPCWAYAVGSITTSGFAGELTRQMNPLPRRRGDEVNRSPGRTDSITRQ
jgi:hypothetical protein